MQSCFISNFNLNFDILNLLDNWSWKIILEENIAAHQRDIEVYAILFILSKNFKLGSYKKYNLISRKFIIG